MSEIDFRPWGSAFIYCRPTDRPTDDDSPVHRVVRKSRAIVFTRPHVPSVYYSRDIARTRAILSAAHETRTVRLLGNACVTCTRYERTTVLSLDREFIRKRFGDPRAYGKKNKNRRRNKTYSKSRVT